MNFCPKLKLGCFHAGLFSKNHKPIKSCIQDVTFVPNICSKLSYSRYPNVQVLNTVSTYSTHLIHVRLVLLWNVGILTCKLGWYINLPSSSNVTYFFFQSLFSPWLFLCKYPCYQEKNPCKDKWHWSREKKNILLKKTISNNPPTWIVYITWIY